MYNIFSRKVVGWAMDTRVKDTLAMSALNQAVGRERPGRGLIVHTDQGAQYTSKRFCARLQRHGFSQSMSRKSNPHYCDSSMALVGRISLHFGEVFRLKTLESPTGWHG